MDLYEATRVNVPAMSSPYSSINIARVVIMVVYCASVASTRGLICRSNIHHKRTTATTTFNISSIKMIINLRIQT